MLSETKENESEPQPTPPGSPTKPETATPPLNPIEHKVGHKPKWPFLIIGILLALLIGMSSYIFLGKNIMKKEAAVTPTSIPPQQVACTQEAKLCPDGVTYVSRSGPKCEFTLCPTETASSKDTSSWKTYTGDKYSFKYPPETIIYNDIKDYPLIAYTSGGGIPIIGIDFRAQDAYQNTINSAKENLVDVMESNYKNGVKITGKGKSGMAQGTKITKFILPYKNSAVIIETNDSDVSSELLNQFMATLKFN